MAVNREPRGWEKASDHTPVTIVFDIRQSLSIEELENQYIPTEGSVLDILGREYEVGDFRPPGIYIVNGQKVYLTK